MFCRLLLCFCGFGPGLAQTRVLSHQSGHKIRKVNADWIFKVLTLNQQDADPWNSYCAAHPYPFSRIYRKQNFSRHGKCAPQVCLYNTVPHKSSRACENYLMSITRNTEFSVLSTTDEPPHEKTNSMYMQNQRRRSASW